MSAIGDWIAQHITEPLQEMIIDSVNGVIISFLESLVNTMTGTMAKEIKLASSLLDNQYFMTAVHYAQGIAITLLAVRIAYQAFQIYVLYSTGEESHPGDLLKSTFVATAVIASVPWITKQVFMFAFSIVDDIQGFQVVPQIETIQEAIATIVLAQTGMLSIPIALVFIGGLILWLIVLIQMAVRAVNVGILMIIGPFLWAMKDELGRTWFSSLLSQCLAMPVQMFLLRGALGTFASVTDPIINTLLFIGFMWATVKFPAFLNQLVIQTGVGGAIGGTAQHVGSAVVIRRMLARR